MAYVKKINKNSVDSHQTSPGYVLTFTRFSNRDPYNYKFVGNLETRKPLVVVSDAISINIEYNKSSPTPTFSCILKQGDLNYLTAIHPGDFVTVNMVNWETKAMEIRDRAIAGDPINRKEDGFKGLFKILDVNMALSVSGNGTKEYQVQVTARGFDEFNNVLYFNPALVNEVSNTGGGMLFLNSFNNFKDLVQSKESSNVQSLVKTVINRTIGQGLLTKSKEETKLNQAPAYEIPSQVANLLNLPKARNVSDINKYYLGIWKINSSKKISNDSYDGFCDFFTNYDTKNKTSNFYKTSTQLQGSRQISFQDFQTVKVWSLMQDYSNPILNESYTCYRIAPDGYIYPSVIVRQKPFNTLHYNKKGPISNHTKYLDIPRWEVDPDLILSMNIGRSDQGRINFVQVFSRALSVDSKFDAASQITLGNFVEDTADVRRHGRKPYIVTCNYDPPNVTTAGTKAREWAYLMADWLFEGHLKMNGNLELVGIEEPICIGDNLELDGIVYHIESLNHTMGISRNGVKIFRTKMTLSMGVDKNSSTIPKYAEMEYTDSFTRRKDDYNKERILPGFSDSQDIIGRVKGEEVVETEELSFTNPKAPKKGNKK